MIKKDLLDISEFVLKKFKSYKITYEFFCVPHNQYLELLYESGLIQRVLRIPRNELEHGLYTDELIKRNKYPVITLIEFNTHKSIINEWKISEMRINGKILINYLKNHGIILKRFANENIEYIIVIDDDIFEIMNKENKIESICHEVLHMIEDKSGLYELTSMSKQFADEYKGLN